MNRLKEGISLRKIHNWLIIVAVILSWHDLGAI